MKKILVIFCILIFSATANFTDAKTTSYDKYGRKTGSYKTNSNGTTTHYDKHGKKVGSYR